MALRRLALVCGLTLADYLLWNWSLSGNHTVLALVSGLTLPFLLLASSVLFALTLARVISGSLRSGSVRRPHVPAGGPRSATGQGRQHRARRPGAPARLLRRTHRPAAGPPSPEPTAASVPSGSPSGASSARPAASSARQPGSSARQRAA
jgi:hypothetical protein